jgi:proteasome beta subunit
MDMNDELKKITRHGTTTVGMVCSDGIVLAADKRVTLGGMFVAHKKFDKVIKVTDNLALTVAGSVSEAQLVVRLLQAELKLKSMRTGTVSNINEAVNLLGTIVYQNIRKFSPIVAITGFVVGGVDDRGFHLYEVGPDGSIMKHDDFIADGSGMMMAFGVFERLLILPSNVILRLVKGLMSLRLRKQEFRKYSTNKLSASSRCNFP